MSNVIVICYYYRPRIALGVVKGVRNLLPHFAEPGKRFEPNRSLSLYLPTTYCNNAILRRDQGPIQCRSGVSASPEHPVH